MDIVLILALVTVILALAFDFTNGFHDSANQVATVITSNALKPFAALGIAAAGDFIGAYFLGTAVAQTLGKGIVDPTLIKGGNSGALVVIAALCGAIAWNLITWYFGLPSSSSHALVGGLIGAFVSAWGLGPINWQGVFYIVLVMVGSPLLGFMLSYIFTGIVFLFTRRVSPKVNRVFNKLQVFSLVAQSLSHGTNDAQKTMGVITFVLIILGIYRPSGSHAFVPGWVILACSIAIATGTITGGWRIIKTLGRGLYKIKPVHAMSSQITSASVIYLSAFLGFPISTTQVISSTIVGAGTATRAKMVRWLVARDMALAWLVTLPVSAIIAAICFFIIKFLLT